MQQNPPPNCSAAPIDYQDWQRWSATIKGPPDSPYEGGEFHLIIELPYDYPAKPPIVTFHTKIYHPNITSIIGLNMLTEDWSPEHTIREVLSSIHRLLIEPNLDRPLGTSGYYRAKLYKENREEYNRTARACTQAYAIQRTDDDGDAMKNTDCCPIM